MFGLKIYNAACNNDSIWRTPPKLAPAIREH
jgi:hypothetical protein